MVTQPKYIYIDLADLFLDDINPRLPKSLHNQDEKSIIEYLLLEASTLEIMQSIGENGFFPGEQLLVIEENEKYRVLEGNRRLSSLLLLQDYSLATVKKNITKQIFDEAKYRPNKIPCLLFTNKDQVSKYIGFKHMTGMKSWSLNSKARYLNELEHKHFTEQPVLKSSRNIAKIIGSRQDYVKRLLIAYKVYEHIEDEGFYQIKGLDDTTFYIGYISDSLSRSNISKYLGVDLDIENPLLNKSNENIKNWTHWFFEKNSENKTRLKGKSEDLNNLNKVLGNELARKEFIDKGKSLSVAYEFAEDINYIFKNSVKKALNQLELSDNVVHKVSDFYIDIEEDLVEIRKLTTKLKNAKDEFTKPKFDNDEF